MAVSAAGLRLTDLVVAANVLVVLLVARRRLHAFLALFIAAPGQA